MIELENNEMLVKDESGKEHVMKILFTYDNESRKKSYVFLYDENDEDNVLAFSYNENTKELSEILDDEEYSEVEEVFNAFLEDPKMQEIKDK